MAKLNAEIEGRSLPPQPALVNVAGMQGTLDDINAQLHQLQDRQHDIEDQTRTAGIAAGRVVDEAAQLSPHYRHYHNSGWLGGALHDVGKFSEQFAGGVGDAAMGTVTGVVEMAIHPTRLVALGQLAWKLDIAQSLLLPGYGEYYLATHYKSVGASWRDLAKGVGDWKDLSNGNVGRWLGNVTTNIAAVALSGGAMAAVKGGLEGLRGAEVAADAGVAANVAAEARIGNALRGVDALGLPEKVGDQAFTFREDAAQRALSAKAIKRWLRPHIDDHTSVARRVKFADGTDGFFKPSSGESLAGRTDPAFVEGQLWRNEIGVHEVDKALDFGLTSTTTSIVGPDGVRGSLALYNGENLELYVPGEMHPIEVQRGAVLHYISGNTDGHLGNVRVQLNGAPAVIDGGLAFASGLPKFGPFGTPVVDKLKSVFFSDVIGQPLDHSIVSAAKSVDTVALSARLTELGIHPASVQGVLERLAEVRGGMITGHAYPGEIVGLQRDDFGWLKWGAISKPAVGGAG